MEKLVEFAEIVGQTVQDVEVTDTEYIYRYIATETLRPYGFLFWGAPDTRLNSVLIAGEEQLVKGIEPISIRYFLNPYISIEAVQYWVQHRAKLQYTNLALPIIGPGMELVVKVDHNCVICLCGMKQEKHD